MQLFALWRVVLIERSQNAGGANRPYHPRAKAWMDADIEQGSDKNRSL
jgi:hypothetical protein